MFDSINNCHNVDDFRNLAKKKLPSPIFHYIDGAADDEITYKRNTSAFDSCDLVPNVLAGIDKIDMSTTVMGQKIDMPLYCAPTALQRLFHYEGEVGVAKAAEKFGTMFGISSLGTASIEEISSLVSTPKLFQLYVHKDEGLNRDLIDRCKDSNFEAMAVTVDTAVGGNRERDLQTGFTIPMKLSLNSALSFMTHPSWALNYFTKPKWELSNLKNHIDAGTNVMTSIGDYFTNMLDNSLDWKGVEKINKNWENKKLNSKIMIEQFFKLTDIKKTKILFFLNHGWKYSSSSKPLRIKSYWNSSLNLGVCADWFVGPRLESGWISAHDLFEKIN